MKISFGAYYHGDSLLHHLDPRIKLILCLFFMVTVFSLSSFWGIGAGVVVVGALVVLSGLPLRVVWRSVKTVVSLVIFIFILNMIATGDGRILVEWWIFRITDQGILRALFMSCRLVLLVLSTGIFLTLTTTPFLLADAMESLMSPLKKLRFPVHETAMMMSLALRFIPTLAEETDKIMKAQASRGANYDTGSIKDRVRAYLTVLIPLFVNAFKRAEDLSDAMEARCYRGGEGRTRMKVLRTSRRDWQIFSALTIACSALFLLDFFLRIG